VNDEKDEELKGQEPILLYLLKHSLIQRHRDNVQHSRSRGATPKRPLYQPLTHVLKWKDNQSRYQRLGKEILSLCRQCRSLIPISDVQLTQKQGTTMYTLQCFQKWTMDVGLLDQAYYLEVHFPHKKRIRISQLQDFSTFFYSEMMQWVLCHVCDLVNDTGLFPQPWKYMSNSVVGCFADSNAQ
jgi:hypothetical protein